MSETNKVFLILRLRGEPRMVSIPAGSSVADLVNVAQDVFKTPETLVAFCWGRALPYTDSVDGLSEAECVHLVSLGK